MSDTPIPGYPLRPGRVHEVCGAGATAFAAICAAPGTGPVLWIREDRAREALTPQGLLPFLDPARLLIAQTRTQADSLAVAEEALKDGSVPLVVLAVTRPLDLREGRRLQLAAGAGGATGLCLIPEGMGSNAAETRWRATPRLAPQPGPDSTPFRWESIKNKSGTIGVWDVLWETATHRLRVVSPSRE